MLKRIAIIGPESTGKSTLAQNLAEYFQTLWVPEFAREYLNNLGRAYLFDDLKEIAKGQLNLEAQMAAKATNYLFCDTDLTVIKIWSLHAYGKLDEWIEKQLAENPYDFYILTNIDLPWEPDPLREHPELRQFFFDWYKRECMERNLPFVLVSGQEQERFEMAKKAILKL